MTIPANYNGVSMKVAPAQLSIAADAIESLLNVIANELLSIRDTLAALHGGWDGTSAAQAKDFSDQWLATMTELFGPGGSGGGPGQAPYPGVFPQVIAGLRAAASNYSAAESAITMMFGTLSNELTAGVQSSATGPVPAGSTITDGSLTAVGEINWTAV